MNDHPAARHAADGLAGLAVIGTLTGYLPSIAAFLGIIWYALQIYDWVAAKIAGRKSISSSEPST